MSVAETSDLPQPPFVLSNIEYLNVVVQLDEETARTVLQGTGLEPSPALLGGFLIFVVPSDDRLGAFSVAQAWVDVAGFNSSDGSSARSVIGGYYSGIYGEIMRRIYRAPVLSGDSVLENHGDEVIGRAFHDGSEIFRIRARLLPGDPQWRTSMHFFVRPRPDGHVVIHHVGHSSLAQPAEPVSLEILEAAPASLARIRPLRLVRSFRQRMHLTVGVPIESGTAQAAAAEPDLIYLLSRLNRGAILVDRDQGITFVNTGAETLLGTMLTPPATSFGHRATRRARPPLDAVILHLSKKRVASTPMAVSRRDGRPPLLLTGVPLGSEDAGGQTRREPAATLVLVIDPDDPAETGAASSLELLGLTPAEARVATLVGSGLAPREVAAMLGNTEGTVRVQLQRAYGKLNISRQSELAAMVARVARLQL